MGEDDPYKLDAKQFGSAMSQIAHGQAVMAAVRDYKKVRTAKSWRCLVGVVLGEDDGRELLFSPRMITHFGPASVLGAPHCHVLWPAKSVRH